MALGLYHVVAPSEALFQASTYNYHMSVSQPEKRQYLKMSKIKPLQLLPLRFHRSNYGNKTSRALGGEILWRPRESEVSHLHADENSQDIR